MFEGAYDSSSAGKYVYRVSLALRAVSGTHIKGARRDPASERTCSTAHNQPDDTEFSQRTVEGEPVVSGAYKCLVVSNSSLKFGSFILFCGDIKMNTVGLFISVSKQLDSAARFFSSCFVLFLFKRCPRSAHRHGKRAVDLGGLSGETNLVYTMRG